MTRINTIHVRLLADQHLIAEKKEINQLAGQFLKSFRSPKFNYSALPKAFTLGIGHVSYFYPFGAYIRNRYNEVFEECIRRRINATNDFNDVWKDKGVLYNRNYTPTEKAIQDIKDRIKERILEKPDFYRYESKKIDVESYLQVLEKNDITLLKFQE